MACDTQCMNCTSTGGDFKISDAFSPPASADPGQLVTIDVPIVTRCINDPICFVPFYRDIWVCLYDNQNQLCITNKSATYVEGGITVQLTYIQPTNRNFYGNISLIQRGFLGNSCDDVKTILVTTNVPASQKYLCNPITNMCEQNDNGIPLYDCRLICTSGIGAPCDLAQNINIMGLCLPKQVVFLGAILIGLSIYSSSR